MNKSVLVPTWLLMAALFLFIALRLSLQRPFYSGSVFAVLCTAASGIACILFSLGKLGVAAPAKITDDRTPAARNKFESLILRIIKFITPLVFLGIMVFIFGRQFAFSSDFSGINAFWMLLQTYLSFFILCLASSEICPLKNKMQGSTFRKPLLQMSIAVITFETIVCVVAWIIGLGNFSFYKLCDSTHLTSFLTGLGFYVYGILNKNKSHKRASGWSLLEEIRF